MVASLLFRTAAFVPQVIYTNAFQYTETGMTGGPTSGAANPTLGYTNFGLTYARGVVVGNQATGENATKIGFVTNPRDGRANFVNDPQFVTGIKSGAYNYFSHALKTPETAPNAGNAVYWNNESLYFDWTTDLRMFNHATRVWFDNRNDGYGAKIKTYALYDDAKATAVVSTTETNVADADNLTVDKMTALVDGTADAANNWDNTKMVTNSQEDNAAFFNYAFAAMNTENRQTNAGVARTTDFNFGTNDISAISPVQLNDNATASSHQLYLLISNQDYAGDHVLDVVISLDMTMTKVVQSNTTTKPKSVGVLASNGATGTQYFGVAADDGLLGTGANVGNGAQGTTQDYVTLAADNLLNSPKTTLGTKVAAIEITGTKNGINTNAPGAVNAGTASTVAPMTSTYFYQLTENTLKETKTVTKVDTANQDVHLSDGSVLHQSVFAEDTDATFTKDMEGYDGVNTGVFGAGFRLIAGRDYTFTLDEAGHYIYWETATDPVEFVYGTYIDWTSAVASSHFDYPMVYVNTEGEGKLKVNVTSVYDDDGTNAANGAATAAMDNESYDAIILPKRDSNASGNNSGFVKGRYVGYALGSDGKLTEVSDTDSQETGFLQGNGTVFGTAGGITVNSRSVAVGAEAVNGAPDLFLTNNTKFIIVDGAGTDNQTAVVKNGIDDLMKGMDTVVINGSTAISSSDYLNPLTTPYQMFYYKAGPFQYDQSYDPSAREIKTLFVPAACVKFNASSTASMVFVGDSDAKIINSNNGQWATLFTVYRNGEGEDVWIKGHYTTASTDAKQIVDNGDNVFYNLVDSGKTATDGKPIYTIAPVADDAKILGQYWDDTTSNGEGDTVTTKPAGYDTLYKATTYSQQIAYIGGTNNSTDLYNVGSAKITNLNTSAYPGIEKDNLTTLNGASSLYDNVGVPVSCILSDDYVVSCIYVNA